MADNKYISSIKIDTKNNEEASIYKVKDVEARESLNDLDNRLKQTVQTIDATSDTGLKITLSEGAALIDLDDDVVFVFNGGTSSSEW